MDFVSDALFDGRRLRALTLLDIFTREALAIEVDKGITGEQVASVLQAVIAGRGAPKRIRVDNGPEFVSNALDRWAYENKVTLDFSRPGRPIDNAFVESFNGRLREECLNAHWFLSLDDARAKIEAWRTSRTRAGLTRRSEIVHRANLLHWPGLARPMKPQGSLAARQRNRGTVKKQRNSTHSWMRVGAQVTQTPADPPQQDLRTPRGGEWEESEQLGSV